MKTDMQLRSEYAEKSWEYELPDRLESALEDDYVANSDLYTADVFRIIRVTYSICPEIEPDELLSAIRSWGLNIDTN